jgi:CHASE3 domain sensor protein
MNLNELDVAIQKLQQALKDSREGKKTLKEIMPMISSTVDLAVSNLKEAREREAKD